MRMYWRGIRAYENSLAKASRNIEVDGKEPKGRPKYHDMLDADLTTSRDELAPLLNRTKSGEVDFVISEN